MGQVWQEQAEISQLLGLCLQLQHKGWSLQYSIRCLNVIQMEVSSITYSSNNANKANEIYSIVNDSKIMISECLINLDNNSYVWTALYKFMHYHPSI